MSEMIPAAGVIMPPKRKMWSLWAIGSAAFVAVWAGWVGLGDMSGFGIVYPLPGIWDSLHLNTAVTLPLSMEAYGSSALRYWLDPSLDDRARQFARRSALGSLAAGITAQVVYHLMTAAHMSHAPWPVVALVSCVPVVAIGLGSALIYTVRRSDKAAFARLAQPVSPEAQRAVPAALPAPVPEPAAPAAPAGPALGTFPRPVPVLGPAPRPKTPARPRAVPDEDDPRLPWPDDDEARRELVNSLKRNDLVRRYQLTKHRADQYRAQYLNDEEASSDVA